MSLSVRLPVGDICAVSLLGMKWVWFCRAYNHTLFICCLCVYMYVHIQEQFNNLTVGIKLPHLVSSLRAQGASEEVSIM